MRSKFWLIASFIATSLSTAAMAQEIDWQKVDDAFGRKAAVSGDVHRYGFPRGDLSVTLDGVTIKPALALEPTVPVWASEIAIVPFASLSRLSVPSRDS